MTDVRQVLAGATHVWGWVAPRLRAVAADLPLQRRAARRRQPCPVLPLFRSGAQPRQGARPDRLNRLTCNWDHD